MPGTLCLLGLTCSSSSAQQGRSDVNIDCDSVVRWFTRDAGTNKQGLAGQTWKRCWLLRWTAPWLRPDHKQSHRSGVLGCLHLLASNISCTCRVQWDSMSKHPKLIVSMPCIAQALEACKVSWQQERDGAYQSRADLPVTAVADTLMDLPLSSVPSSSKADIAASAFSNSMYA